MRWDDGREKVKTYSKLLGLTISIFFVMIKMKDTREVFMVSKISFDECFICEKSVPTEKDPWNNGRQRFNCPDCGDYQVTNEIKEIYKDEKTGLKNVVQANQHLNTDDTILDISKSGGITAAKR